MSLWSFPRKLTKQAVLWPPSAATGRKKLLTVSFLKKPGRWENSVFCSSAKAWCTLSFFVLASVCCAVASFLSKFDIMSSFTWSIEDLWPSWESRWPPEEESRPFSCQGAIKGKFIEINSLRHSILSLDLGVFTQIGPWSRNFSYSGLTSCRT